MYFFRNIKLPFHSGLSKGIKEVLALRGGQSSGNQVRPQPAPNVAVAEPQGVGLEWAGLDSGMGALRQWRPALRAGSGETEEGRNGTTGENRTQGPGRLPRRHEQVGDADRDIVACRQLEVAGHTGSVSRLRPGSRVQPDRSGTGRPDG